MAKQRVYELAKELGVDSKTVLEKLKDMGEFVKSASSTVEAPVVRRLKASAFCAFFWLVEYVSYFILPHGGGKKKYEI